MLRYATGASVDVRQNAGRLVHSSTYESPIALVWTLSLVSPSPAASVYHTSSDIGRWGAGGAG
jgi:hypothetical protein